MNNTVSAETGLSGPITNFKKTALTTIIMGLTAVSMSSFAQAEDTGWYLGAQLSGVEVDDSDLEVENGSAAGGTIGPGKHQISIDSGAGISFIGGYDMPGLLRFELELKHNQNDVSETELEGGATLTPDPLEGEEANATFLLGGVYLDFMRDEPLSPYIGLGIGGADVDTAEDVVAAGQFAAGFAWAVSDAVKVDFGYRYMTTEDGDVEVDNQPNADVTTSYEAQSINVGVRYHLGAASRTARLDSDGDGIYDGRDRCSATPLGASVDSSGCPSDADADGVYDGIDSCAATPRATPVDPFGCPEEAQQLSARPQPRQRLAADRDGDGVADSKDVCPGTRGQASLSNGCGSGQSLVLDGVTFASGSARLAIPAQTKLYKVWVAIRNDVNANIEIRGHSDNVGSASLNRSLSQKRAESVRAFLVQLGLPSRNLTARGYGDSNPVASNATELGRSQNRRVELYVR